MPATRVPPPLWALIWVAAQAVLTRLAGGRRRFPGQTVVTATLAVTGVALAGAGARELRRHGTQLEPMDPSKTVTLVSSGIYRRTRNPIYLALALLLSANAARTGRRRALLAVAGFVACLTPQIHAEERALQATFGDTYRDYRAATRRWL